MDNGKKSALNVMGGIEQPQQINNELVSRLKQRKPRRLSPDEFAEGVLQGNCTILSKAITLVESSLQQDQELAQQIIALCLSRLRAHRTTPTFRVGITGVPGVGKSTFIEVLGKHLTGLGHRVAVLAIDPSSSRSKGSILGDKTRMEELSADPNAYIRPSPSAGSLGGVARKTRETITLCEAAGFDVIFVETVGVGQSETAVHSMVDFFLLLMLAGAGDELQGIKRGIIEMADAIVINKADGDNLVKARAAKAEYASALHLFPQSDSGWTPVADTCSARTREGIDRVWQIILEHRSITSQSGYLARHRQRQDLGVLRESVESEVLKHFYSSPSVHRKMELLEKQITGGIVNPYRAARELLDEYFKESE